MTRSCPALAYGAEPRIGSMKPSIWPPIRSWNAGAEPLYGTIRYSMPLARRSSSVDRWPAEPVEPIAKVSLPGFAFACAIRLLMSVTGRSLLIGDGQRRLRHQRDRREVLDDVVGRGLHRHRRRSSNVDGVEQQRVAVGRRLLHRDRRRSCRCRRAGSRRRRSGPSARRASAPACGPTTSSVPPGGNGMMMRHRLGRIGLRQDRRCRRAEQRRGDGGAKECLRSWSCLLVSCAAQRFEQAGVGDGGAQRCHLGLVRRLGGRAHGRARRCTPASYMPAFMRACASPVGSPPP